MAINSYMTVKCQVILSGDKRKIRGGIALTVYLHGAEPFIS